MPRSQCSGESGHEKCGELRHFTVEAGVPWSPWLPYPWMWCWALASDHHMQRERPQRRKAWDKLCTVSPGMVEMASPPWSTDYFSPVPLPHGLFPQVGMLPWQSTHSCLSQSSAIRPTQAKPIFISLKATEPNALVLMLQVKIPETVFHLKMDKKMGHTSCCCSPVNYSDMHYSGQYKKVPLFLVGAVNNATSATLTLSPQTCSIIL